MVIISKDKSQIINMDLVPVLYFGSDGYKISVNFSSGNGCMIGRYSSPEAAAAAMKMLWDAIGSVEKFAMPSDEVAEKNIDRGGCSSSYRNGYHGAKPTRHGGS